MIIKNQGLRVEKARTKLIATHNGEDLIFLHPAYGPGNYASIQGQIEKDGLAKPTMAELASLVYDAHQNPENEFSKGIVDLLEPNGLWGFTGSLYTPKGVAYIQDNPQIKNGMPFMDENELIKKLESGDPSVRFVPFGFKIGEMTALELSKNPYVVGLAGEERAEKLAKVADKYKLDPFLWSFESVGQPLTRVSALVSSWSGHRLDVFGNYRGDGWDGCAFGVSKTGEASRAEK